MKRLQKDAVVLSLLEEMQAHGSWCGETHLQKATYFLQELLETPLGFDFILYKHGPFSFDLRDEITAMRGDFLINYKPQPYPYGPSLVQDAGGARLKERFPKTIRQYSKKISFVAETLGNKGVSELERLGTALYFTRRQNGKDEPLDLQMHKLKPHISPEEAQEALRQVADIVEMAKKAKLVQ